MDKRMITPAEICDEVIASGVKKANLKLLPMCFLGILAGAFIAIGGYASSMAAHSIENVGIAKMASGAIFPVGLILVILCGAELFTGNSLMVMPLMERKVQVKQVLRNWLVVYICNFIGSFIVAYLIFKSGLLETNLGKVGGYAIKIASVKGGLSFTKAFTSGILCNFVVCLAVWGAAASKDVVGKIFMIWFPIMAFVVSGFEHSVANMYYFSIGILASGNESLVKAADIGSKIANVNFNHAIENLIPVTLGNIVGGAVFVGLSYWIIFKSQSSSYLEEKQNLNI